MRVSIDRVGRLVIPKSVRVALGIGPDSQLELTAEGAGLRLDIVNSQHRTISESDGLPVLGLVAGIRLTDDEVRRLRDEVQR